MGRIFWIILRLWSWAAFLAINLTLPMPAQIPAPAPQSKIVDPAERTALHAALNLADTRKRASALEDFLKRYPNSPAKIEAMTGAMKAYEQAGELVKAETTANAILGIEPHNAEALALIESLNSASLPPAMGEPPADPIAAWACRMQEPFGLFGMADVILQLRDVSPCNQAAAARVWAQILNLERSRKILVDAKILSSTTDTIGATVYYGSSNVNPDWWSNCQRVSKYCPVVVPQRDVADLRIALHTPLPYELPFGAVTQVTGTITGYNVQPFSYVVENAELPNWSEFGCDDKNMPNLIPVQEYFLDHRDATPCTQHAADLIWGRMSDHRLEFSAQVVSATAYDMETAIVQKEWPKGVIIWKSPVKDLHVTFAKPWPFVPRPGPTVRVSGLITGYATDPFQFRMEEGKAPDLICAWVQQVGAAALSFDEWLYVLRAGNQSDCTRKVAREVWDAINERQQQSRGLKLSVRVVSAAPRLIEATLDTQRDEEIAVQIRTAKPMGLVPASGTLVNVRGYLSYHLDELPEKRRPLTLVMVNGVLEADPAP